MEGVWIEPKAVPEAVMPPRFWFGVDRSDEGFVQGLTIEYDYSIAMSLKLSPRLDEFGLHRAPKTV